MKGLESDARYVSGSKREVSMDEKDLVSVVVPVYNVEQYVGRCIESLTAQTYSNIEIILVDDGSRDRSGAICDQYSERDRRVVTIHKKNGGLSDARNEGIRHARGKWITFVDSDDFVHPEYVRILNQNITESGADISVCQFVQKRSTAEKEIGDESETQLIPDSPAVYSKREGLEKLLYQYISTSACAKMYKIELFQETFFPYGKLYEDVVTVFDVFSKAEHIAVSNSCLYYYCVRGDSIIRKGFAERKLDYIQNTKYVLNKTREAFPGLEKAAISRALWADVHVVVQIGRDKNFLKVQNELWEEVKKYRKTVLADKKSRLQNKVVMFLSYSGKRITCDIYCLCRLLK